jgi:hypothetical protein
VVNYYPRRAKSSQVPVTSSFPLMKLQLGLEAINNAGDVIARVKISEETSEDQQIEDKVRALVYFFD